MNPHRYLPQTTEDIKVMLERCGVETIEDLYSDIDPKLRLKQPYDLPTYMSEPEVDRYFGELAKLNREMTIFAGAGYYYHYTPAAIGAILSRS